MGIRHGVSARYLMMTENYKQEYIIFFVQKVLMSYFVCGDDFFSGDLKIFKTAPAIVCAVRSGESQQWRDNEQKRLAPRRLAH